MVRKTWEMLRKTWEMVRKTLIIEGATEKVLQFIMPLKSIYSKNQGFVKQKMYF
jgi:hypothetical protein